MDIIDVHRKKFFFDKFDELSMSKEKHWIARLEGCCGYPKMATMSQYYDISISTLPSYIYSTILFARQSYL